MRLGRSASWVVGACAVAALAGCGDKSPESATDSGAAPAGAPSSSDDDPETAMRKATESTAQSLKQMNAGKDVKAVEPAALKALLPEKFGKHARANVESMHQNTMGMDMSFASASYDPPEE